MKKVKEDQKIPFGRPTKYKPEYCEMIVKFFDREPTKEIEKTVINKKGDIVTVKLTVPNKLPTLERFALDLDVHTETLSNWANEYPDFFDALRKAKIAQKEVLTQNALMGFYEKGYAKFTAVNLTDWRDKKEIEVTSSLLDNKSDTELAQKAIELLK